MSPPNLEEATSNESESEFDDETQTRIDTEKAMSEMDISSLKGEGDSSSDSSVGQQPVRLVIGQQSEKDHRYNFAIIPVDKHGRSLSKNGLEKLEDKGNKPLDLQKFQHLAMDWKNNSRSCPNYVMVQSKELVNILLKNTNICLSLT